MRTSSLLPIGAALGLIGFAALGVEGLRVAIGNASLSGWQSAVPWVGLGLLAVGAILLVLALTADDGEETSAR